MKTSTTKYYWQAELYRGGEVYNADFPRRETKEDAKEDARTAMAELGYSERRWISAAVSEWETDGDTSRNTGRYAKVN